MPPPRETSRLLERCATLVLAVLVVLPSGAGDAASRADRLARQLLYKSGTEVELNLVLVIPLKGPQHDVSLGIFLEANYDLPPYNSQAIFVQPLQILEQRLREPSRGRRATPTSRVHRAAVYRAVEVLLERLGGMPGRACLLRSICEAASFPLEHDGLVGQLLHVILTPSSTAENGGLHSDYPAAEELGRRGADCGATFPACPATPLDLISTIASWVPP